MGYITLNSSYKLLQILPMANKKAVTVLSKVCEIEAFPSEYAVMAHLRKVIDNDDEDDDCNDDGDGNDDQGNTNDYYMGQVHIDDD